MAGNANNFHGGITHSVVFAALVASLVAFIPYPALPSRGWRFLLALALLASHPAMDILQSHLGLGFTGGSGLALFAPITYSRFSSPFSIFLGMKHRTWDLLLSPYTVRAILLELLWFVPSLFLLDLLRNRRRSSGSARARPR